MIKKFNEFGNDGIKKYVDIDESRKEEFTKEEIEKSEILLHEINDEFDISDEMSDAIYAAIQNKYGCTKNGANKFIGNIISQLKSSYNKEAIEKIQKNRTELIPAVVSFMQKHVIMEGLDPYYDGDVDAEGDFVRYTNKHAKSQLVREAVEKAAKAMGVLDVHKLYWMDVPIDAIADSTKTDSEDVLDSTMKSIIGDKKYKLDEVIEHDGAKVYVTESSEPNVYIIASDKDMSEKNIKSVTKRIFSIDGGAPVSWDELMQDVEDIHDEFYKLADVKVGDVYNYTGLKIKRIR